MRKRSVIAHGVPPMNAIALFPIPPSLTAANKCPLWNFANSNEKRYISDRLPPVLEEEEEAASVVTRGDALITPLTKVWFGKADYHKESMHWLKDMCTRAWKFSSS